MITLDPIPTRITIYTGIFGVAIFVWNELPAYERTQRGSTCSGLRAAEQKNLEPVAALGAAWEIRTVVVVDPDPGKLAV